MAKSILQDEKCCWFCGTTYDIHEHHVYGGKNRKVSEMHGFKAYLCGRDHNMSDAGVHFNKEKDLILKRACQAKFEETHSHEEFMKLIGRNYRD